MPRVILACHIVRKATTALDLKELIYKMWQ